MNLYCFFSKRGNFNLCEKIDKDFFLILHKFSRFMHIQIWKKNIFDWVLFVFDLRLKFILVSRFTCRRVLFPHQIHAVVSWQNKRTSNKIYPWYKLSNKLNLCKLRFINGKNFGYILKLKWTQVNCSVCNFCATSTSINRNLDSVHWLLNYCYVKVV
jgi:hypothetical protein